MDSDDSRIPATGHLAMPDVAWEQAQLRARLIRELAERDPVGLDAADRVAVELGPELDLLMGSGGHRRPSLLVSGIRVRDSGH